MKVSRWKFFGLTFLVLVWLFCMGVAFDPQRSIGAVMGPIGMGGLIAWMIVAIFSTEMKRPFGRVDAIRCLGWILIGGSLCLSQFAPPYFWKPRPAYVQAIFSASWLGVLAGFSMIVLASIFLAKPRIPSAGNCQKCGYDLAGNASGLCPECGTAISKTVGD